MPKKTPLPWLILVRQKSRLIVAIAGIAFADMLMFLQLGFQGALFDAAIKPHRSLDADLVLINPQFRTLFSVKSFSRERLYQTLGFAGVDRVSSMYISTGQWRNPKTRESRAILVWGIEPGKPSFQIPELTNQLDRLSQFRTVLFDTAGRPEYGDIGSWLRESGNPMDVEMSDRLLTVNGLFSMGASFAADGNTIVSDSTFLHLFPERDASKIEVGLVQLQPGVDPVKLQATLSANLPEDVRVLTVEEFANVEKQYWAEGTGIGFIFGLGAIMGFIVGIVIVYQILYSDVSDHLSEFATMKAMGYSNGFLVRVLLTESLILAAVGFLPSLALAVGLYQVTYSATLLPIFMTADRAITVLVLTIAMCGASGTIAMQKLYQADPADIF